jgi:hypothetical protein
MANTSVHVGGDLRSVAFPRIAAVGMEIPHIAAVKLVLPRGQPPQLELNGASLCDAQHETASTNRKATRFF